MKKSICVSFALSMLLLAACAGKENAPAVPEPEAPAVVKTETAAPETENVALEPEETQSPEPAPDPVPEPEPAPSSGLEQALACVDQDVSVLYAAVGEPESSRYEYSCSGPGDDGVLDYDGFVVFTYKENGVETVVDAEAE